MDGSFSFGNLLKFEFIFRKEQRKERKTELIQYIVLLRIFSNDSFLRKLKVSDSQVSHKWKKMGCEYFIRTIKISVLV